jgi:hypothetical protein
MPVVFVGANLDLITALSIVMMISSNSPDRNNMLLHDVRQDIHQQVALAEQAAGHNIIRRLGGQAKRCRGMAMKSSLFRSVRAK